MSQKEGAYYPSSETKVGMRSGSRSPARSHDDSKANDEGSTIDEKIATDVIASWSNSSAQPQGQDDGKNDGKNDDQEWAVVNSPRDETNEHICEGMSSHFDLQLGWGKWKWTVFSWDVNIKKTHNHR